MVQLIYAMIVISLVSCSLPQRKKVDMSAPTLKEGCTHLAGKDRVLCIGKLLDELQNMRNSHVSLKRLSDERLDEDYVRVVDEYCLVSKEKELYCFSETRDEYDPSTLGVIKRNLILFGAGYGIGFFSGKVL